MRQIAKGLDVVFRTTVNNSGQSLWLQHLFDIFLIIRMCLTIIFHFRANKIQISK